MNNNDALQLRVEFVNGQFDLDADTLEFMKVVRAEIAGVAARLRDVAPETCDVGRFIAAVDHLQQTKNLFCDSAILGCEATTRKRRKTATAATTGK